MVQTLVVGWLALVLSLPWPGWGAGVELANTPAAIAYKTFADAFIHGRMAEARAMAGSDRVRQIIQRKAAANAAAGGARPIVETLFMIIDERPLADGQVKVHGAQVIQFREPEDDPPAFHRQFITLRQEQGRWLVQEFMDEEEECCK